MMWELELLFDTLFVPEAQKNIGRPGLELLDKALELMSIKLSSTFQTTSLSTVRLLYLNREFETSKTDDWTSASHKKKVNESSTLITLF
jgi:hypothetical protein